MWLFCGEDTCIVPHEGLYLPQKQCVTSCTKIYKILCETIALWIFRTYRRKFKSHILPSHGGPLSVESDFGMPWVEKILSNMGFSFLKLVEDTRSTSGNLEYWLITACRLYFP